MAGEVTEERGVSWQISFNVLFEDGPGRVRSWSFRSMERSLFKGSYNQKRALGRDAVLKLLPPHLR